MNAADTTHRGRRDRLLPRFNEDAAVSRGHRHLARKPIANIGASTEPRRYHCGHLANPLPLHSIDLTHTWSVGGKYAYRLGRLSLDRENEQFFDNRASLYVVRTDVKFFGHYEGRLEGRLLDMTDFERVA